MIAKVTEMLTEALDAVHHATESDADSYHRLIRAFHLTEHLTSLMQRRDGPADA